MPLTRRQIRTDDLPALAQLLARGFRGRRPRYWLAGLSRRATVAPPEGFPQFGYCLESDGKLVGAALTLFSRVPVSDTAEPAIRGNMSSWYVEPDFRLHAGPLLSFALKHHQVTYLNVSPAVNTWSTVEAQGFKLIRTGRRLAFPALGPRRRGVRVRAFDPRRDAAVLPAAEAVLVRDHAALGSICLVAEDGRRPEPFVFAPIRIRRVMPALQLVYTRHIARFGHLAGPLGRVLLRGGRGWVVVDGSDPIPDCPSRPIQASRRIYARGPNPPRRGDVAYTETVYFPP